MGKPRLQNRRQDICDRRPGTRRYLALVQVLPEDFADLCEREGVIPAPYLARARWVALQTEDAVARPELKRLLRHAYDLIFAKLPRKTQAGLK